jgi:hypothetical protein
MFQSIDCINLSTDVEFLCRVIEIFDSWMILITTKHLFGFFGSVKTSQLRPDPAQTRR